MTSTDNTDNTTNTNGGTANTGKPTFPPNTLHREGAWTHTDYPEPARRGGGTVFGTVMAILLLASLIGCATQYKQVRKQGKAIDELSAWSQTAAAANAQLRDENALIRNQLTGSATKQEELRIVAEQLRVERQQDSAKIDALLLGLSRIEDLARTLRSDAPGNRAEDPQRRDPQ